MKPWLDLKSIAMPVYLKDRPRDERGYPIPASVVIDANGKPDFRVINPEKAMAMLLSRRCALCDKSMGRVVTFVGGPLSMRSRSFTDGPMHDECAQYALKVCPFLAAPKFAYSRSHDVAGVEVATIESVSKDRPAYFGHGYTTDYHLMQIPGAVLIIAEPWFGVEWWKDGKALEDEPKELLK